MTVRFYDGIFLDHVDWGVISMSYLCHLDNYGSRARRGCFYD